MSGARTPAAEVCGCCCGKIINFNDSGLPPNAGRRTRGRTTDPNDPGSALRLHNHFAQRKPMVAECEEAWSRFLVVVVTWNLSDW